MSTKAGKSGGFLNVDLEIYSRTKIEPLVVAFGQKVDVLYVGRERHLYSAHLEIAGWPKTADAAIRALAALVKALPRAKRKLWDTAKTRDFNVGVEAAAGNHFFVIELANETIQMVSSLNARIVVTVYPPEQLTSAGRKVTKRGRRRQTSQVAM